MELNLGPKKRLIFFGDRYWQMEKWFYLCTRNRDTVAEFFEKKWKIEVAEMQSLIWNLRRI